MARQFYCSKCGINLKCTRKALKNKMLILDLIDPHECIEGHDHNLKDADRPVDARLDFNNSQASKEEVRQQAGLTNLQYTDRRDPKFRRQESEQVSSAPPGILNTIKGARNDS